MEDIKRLFNYDKFHSSPGDVYLSNLHDAVNLSDFDSSTESRRKLISTAIKKETYGILLGDTRHITFKKGKITKKSLDSITKSLKSIEDHITENVKNTNLQDEIIKVLEEARIKFSIAEDKDQLTFYESCIPKNRVFQFNVSLSDHKEQIETLYYNLKFDGYIECGLVTFKNLFSKSNQFALPISKLNSLPRTHDITRVGWLDKRPSLTYFLRKMSKVVVSEQSAVIYSSANDLMCFKSERGYRLTNLEKISTKRISEKKKEQLDKFFSKL